MDESAKNIDNAAITSTRVLRDTQLKSYALMLVYLLIMETKIFERLPVEFVADPAVKHLHLTTL